MKILVTGGAGYIGSILVPMLLTKGFKVKVVDNFYYRQNSLLDCCYNKDLEIIEGDIRQEDVIRESISDVDVIIPLAAIVGAKACSDDVISSTSLNYEAVKRISELKSKNQWILYPNTNSGYGVGQDGVYCTEETPLNPISLYGKLKIMGEQSVMNKENSITFRLATVFGISPRMRMDLLVNDFTYRALYDKFIVLFESNFKRNYIHVRDVSRAFLYAIENFDNMKNEVYNLGLSDANLSKLELCNKIKKYIPDFNIFESEFNEDVDKRNYIVSNEKIESKGFQPFYSIDDGIKELIKGYKIVKNNQYTNL